MCVDWGLLSFPAMVSASEDGQGQLMISSDLLSHIRKSFSDQHLENDI